jgi:hypothetical protein
VPYSNPIVTWRLHHAKSGARCRLEVTK